MILSTLTIPHSHTSHPSKLLWHATYLYKFSLRSAIDPSSRWYVRSIFPNGKKLAARRTNLTRASWFEFVKIASFPLAKESAPFVNPVAQMHARLYGRHLTIPDSTSWKNWQRNELPDFPGCNNVRIIWNFSPLLLVSFFYLLLLFFSFLFSFYSAVSLPQRLATKLFSRLFFHGA